MVLLPDRVLTGPFEGSGAAALRSNGSIRFFSPMRTQPYLLTVLTKIDFSREGGQIWTELCLDKGAQSTTLRPCTLELQQAAAPYIRSVPNTSSLSLTKRHMYTPQYHHKCCSNAIVSFHGPFGLILSPYWHHRVFLYSITNGYKMRTCKARNLGKTAVAIMGSGTHTQIVELAAYKVWGINFEA